MTSKVVLITGANRGLGKGLVERYLQLPNHTVVAAARNPADPSSQSLSDLPKAKDTRLIVTKIDASVEKDAFDAVKVLQEKHGIEHLDTVIANAGVSYIWPTVADLKIADLKAHLEPNVYGLVWLYQATRELLKKASKEPQFITMGSSAGYLANQPPIPNAAYGPSKVVAHWLTIRIAAEDSWLNAFAMSPGFVATDMGSSGAKGLGIDESHLISVKDSCDGMMSVFTDATKENFGGKMVLWDGKVDAW